MAAFQIKRAERTKVKLKLAIEGPSGSGKTHSSLLIARGLVPGGKVLLIDTENSSASLFSNLFEFYTIDFTPPYTPERYREVLKMAVAEKFDVVIIDSGSHEWNGKGGILEIHDNMPGNSWTNWAKVTPRHDAFIAEMLQSPIHVIMTMRSKEKYIQEEVNGKQKVRKTGLEPVQRDGLTYEFSVVLTMDISHQATSTKDRTGLFAVDQWFTPTEDTGRQIAQWLESGVDVPPVRESQPTPPPTPAPAPTKAPMANQANRKKAIYDGYLEVCEHPEHTKNAIFLVTSGRGSKDWTEEDMTNLELDLKRRKGRIEAERAGNPDWNYTPEKTKSSPVSIPEEDAPLPEPLIPDGDYPINPEDIIPALTDEETPPFSPESARDVLPDIDENIAAEMGIGPDPESPKKPKGKAFSPSEKLREKVIKLFGQEGMGYTEKEREEWIRTNIKVEGLNKLKAAQLEKLIALLEKRIKEKDAVELGGVA